MLKVTSCLQVSVIVSCEMLAGYGMGREWVEESNKILVKWEDSSGLANRKGEKRIFVRGREWESGIEDA